MTRTRRRRERQQPWSPWWKRRKRNRGRRKKIIRIPHTFVSLSVENNRKIEFDWKYFIFNQNMLERIKNRSLK